MEILNTIIKIKILQDGVELPTKATPHAAGFDVRSSETITIHPKEYRAVATGFSMEMPHTIEAQIRPRSGLALKHGVTVLNAPGTIDADYRGEIKIILINHSEVPFHIAKGDRIAQMIFSQIIDISLNVTDNLSESIRGVGGFGSTGKN